MGYERRVRPPSIDPLAPTILPTWRVWRGRRISWLSSVCVVCSWHRRYRRPFHFKEDDLHRAKTSSVEKQELHEPSHAARDLINPIPKNVIPELGMAPDTAYRLIRDEMSLDANPSLNLASFLTTHMDPQAEALMAESAAKNLIDEQEYPRTHVISQRLVSMTAKLFNAPEDGKPVGTTTVGSSEAIMLGLLAHKRSWQKRQRDAGKSDARPNIVIGADVHTCWEKFARYFEVEARVAPMKPGHYTLDAAAVEARIDEHTCAVGGLAGTTFTGQIDDLPAINSLLERVEDERGWNIPLHIDAASGGFVLPFTKPDLAWDFRLSRVRSINVSNHKYGLVYAGLGTLIFRDESDLPSDLVFHINYLGGDMPNYSLNFSRPSAQVVAQYYNFLRLGMDGYRRVMKQVMHNARYLVRQLKEFNMLSVIGDAELFPVVVVCAATDSGLDLFNVVHEMKARGWTIPAYTLPADAQDVTVMRLVVRENLSRDMVDLLVADMRDTLKKPAGEKEAVPRGKPRPIC